MTCSSFAGSLVLQDQPTPTKNNRPAVWDMVIDEIKDSYGWHVAQTLVIKDMEDRDMVGLSRYGTKLQPFNGRNALIDALQEFYDGAVYLKQQIYELRETNPHSHNLIVLETVYWKHMDNLLNLRNYCRVSGAIK